MGQKNFRTWVGVGLVLLVVMVYTGSAHLSRLAQVAIGNGQNVEPPVDPNPPDGEPPVAEIDLELVKPNELGVIPILMYHEIGTEEKEWARTAVNFRQDLQRLYDAGYRPISLSDLVQNRVSVGAGFTPYVLTFDDGTAGQFRYLETADGSKTIDPDCAVGILIDFAEANPDFTPAATFYLYFPRPFRQAGMVEEKLQHLVALGLEIGNHTDTHANLGKLSPEDIQAELAAMARKTRDIVPDYAVTSLALPYGGSPRTEWQPYLAAGAAEGFAYRNDAVLLVGSHPAVSPNHQKYNPQRLPRIQAIQTELDRWLAHLEQYPEKRYISDGDPEIITFPAGEAGNLNPDSLGGKTVRQY